MADKISLPEPEVVNPEKQPVESGAERFFRQFAELTKRVEKLEEAIADLEIATCD